MTFIKQGGFGHEISIRISIRGIDARRIEFVRGNARQFSSVRSARLIMDESLGKLHRRVR